MIFDPTELALIHPNLFRIFRPSDGIFEPDWRLRQVQEYVDATNGVLRHSADVLKRLDAEPDLHVRRLFEFRQTGDCQDKNTYAWAWKCISENESTGFASVIRALNLAGWDAVEIAARLNVATNWIETILALSWDIEPGRTHPEFIRSIVFGGPGRYRNTPEDLREGLLLLSTWTWNRDGVTRLLTPDVGLTDLERADVQREAAQYEASCSQERDFTIAFGGSPQVTVADLYLDKLRSMEALPSRIERRERQKRFKEVLIGISEGTPLSHFLTVPSQPPMPALIENHPTASGDENDVRNSTSCSPRPESSTGRITSTTTDIPPSA